MCDTVFCIFEPLNMIPLLNRSIRPVVERRDMLFPKSESQPFLTHFMEGKLEPFVAFQILF